MRKGIKLGLLLCVLLSGRELMAQTDYRVQEASIANENDVYTFRNQDKYYSNGLLFHFRFVPESGKWLSPKSNDTKFIVDFELIHKFFTPQDVRFDDVDEYERPYAGWLNTGVSFSLFPSESVRWMYGAELGVVGKASGGEGLQTWYHNAVGFPKPRGWQYQIPNEPFVNLKAAFDKQFVVAPRTFDVVSSTEIKVGTGQTNAMQRVDFRLGKLFSLNNSAFKNALIGRGRSAFENRAYFFAGYGIQYVLHDITIQGSLWNDNAPHTEDIVPWVRHLRIGWAASSRNATFKMTYNWLSREVKNARSQAYIGFELLIRFGPRSSRR